MALPITFLSDYGLNDEFVGICHAVIERHSPGTAVIDLGHGVPAGDVRQGAVRLADALAYAPVGVHLAVVDPGVGGLRRPVAIRCDPAGQGSGSGLSGTPAAGPAARLGGERFLVGPDNGLLWPAAERLGGAREAFDLARTPVREEPLSFTFHGRDIFAPVAAHLARGARPEALGTPIGIDTLVRLEIPGPTRDRNGRLQVDVLTIDRFGNASLAARPEDLAGDREPSDRRDPVRRPTLTLEPEHGGAEAVVLGRTFSDVEPGQAVVLTDSNGRIALAVNGGSAAERYGLAAGDQVTLLTPLDLSR